jgi:hypothetical protein
MNRPALLRQTLTGLFESTKGLDVQAVVVIDKDKESYGVCVDLMRTYPNMRVNFSNEQRGAITCWNYGTLIADASIYFHQGDDLSYSDGWLQIALDAFQEKLQGYGLLGVNDGMWDGDKVIATHFLFDKQFCIDHLGGVMAPPCYKYYGVDVEQNARAKLAGRFYWCKESVVKHIHPANGGRARDEVDAYRDPYWVEDAGTTQATGLSEYVGTRY